MSIHALDASAVLAYLWKETGWQTVEAILLADEAIISTVNVCEVATKALDRGFTEIEARDLVGNLGMQEVDFDQLQCWRAAALRSETKSLGLSLGDRACLSLAHSHKATALTADKAWLQLKVGVRIKSIR